MVEPAKKGLRVTKRANWTYLTLVFGSFAIAMVLLTTTLWFSLSAGFDQVVSLGLLQPIVAALLALTVVMAMRLVKGRFVGERRKGSTSASSATIAVRLWAMCFALLAGAMLLFELLAQLPTLAGTQPGKLATTVETEVEVTSSSAPATAKIKVSQ
jgi:hypothetical protein